MSESRKVTKEDLNKIASDSSCTKSSKMILLHDLGLTRKEIANLLGVCDQFVYNVLDKSNRIVKGVSKSNATDKYKDLLK